VKFVAYQNCKSFVRCVCACIVKELFTAWWGGTVAVLAKQIQNWLKTTNYRSF